MLRSILIRSTELRFAIGRVRLDHDGRSVEHLDTALNIADREGTEVTLPPKNTVRLAMLVKGKRPVSHLIAALSDIDGIHEVGLTNNETEFE